MKKGFTLLELIIVIVVTSILMTISSNIIIKAYDNYKEEEAINNLIQNVNTRLSLISQIMKHRIKNSVIALKCTVDDGGCYNGNITDWKRLLEVKPSEEQYYPGLEMITYDENIRRGAWKNDKMQMAYEGMVDLKQTQNPSAGQYTIKSLNSDFDILKTLETEKEKYANPGYSGNPFNDKLAVLIFSGVDGRGCYITKDHSYGYYGTDTDCIYDITGYTQGTDDTDVNIREEVYNSNSDVYERFFIVDGAEAFIPKKNSLGFYDLYVFDHYRPWLGQNFKNNGTGHVLIKNISNLSFKENANKIIINLCVVDPNLKDENGEYIQICREKIID